MRLTRSFTFDKFITPMLTNWWNRSQRRVAPGKRRSRHDQSRMEAAEVLEIRQVPAATAVLQAGVLTITGSEQADNIVVNRVGTNLTVTGVATLFAAGSVSSIIVNAGRGHDSVDLTAVNLPTMVFGGAGNDSLTGGSGQDTLMGESGSDVLRGKAGNDALDGGAGNDRVYGQVGDDVLNGGAGLDTVDGIGSDVTTNSERLQGQVMEDTDDGGADPFVTVQKWGNPTFGTPAVVTYSFMANGVSDTSNRDGGWTNTSITSFMPSGAVAEIKRAFAAWSQVANISFVEVADAGEAFDATPGSDIRIGGHAFDGRGRTLAHGYFPQLSGTGSAGDIHFDLAERWTVNSLNGDPNTIDIFTVAAHEIGHAIGLHHEPTLLALMNPFYSEAINGLQADDIQGVQTLYGQPSTQPPIQVSVSDTQVTEGNSGTTQAVFQLSLNTPSPLPVSVDVTTGNGSALDGEDFRGLSTRVTFSPGEIRKDVVVTVNGDRQFEGDEFFTVTLSNAANAVLADNQGVGTITNDEVPLSLRVDDVQTREGNSGSRVVRVTVYLSEPATETIRFRYRTVDGSAIAGSDYRARTFDLEIRRGQTQKQAEITILGDRRTESDETFQVVIFDVTGGAVIQDDTGVVTIINGD